MLRIYCDRRQLHWYQLFEDQQIKKEGKDSHSSSLFTLGVVDVSTSQLRKMRVGLII